MIAQSSIPSLDVQGLGIETQDLNGRTIQLLSMVSFTLEEGKTSILIGESGSGKTILAASIVRLLPPSLRVSGNVFYQGTGLFSLPEKTLARIRGRKIALIPQQGEASLNPVRRIGDQILDPFPRKKALRQEAYQRAQEILYRLGFLDPEWVLKSFPHQLSGGMNRRVVTAAVLLLDPQFILVDEPTVGLDEENKNKSLDLILTSLTNAQKGILMITHELELLSKVNGKVLVLYGGRIVEETDTAWLFQSPLHPYTKALIQSLPDRGFHPIPGSPYSALSPVAGCPFHPRCSEKRKICTYEYPIGKEIVDPDVSGSRRVWCHLYG